MHKKNKLIIGGEKCLLLQPQIVEIVGKSEALLLQQLHYWINSSNENIGRVVDGEKWIYNSTQQWAKDIKVISVSTIKRAISKLKILGVIRVRCINYKKSDRTNSLTIDYEKLESLITNTIEEKKLQPPLKEEKDLKNTFQLVKMNQSKDQIKPMYIDTKITNKENLYKSEQRDHQNLKFSDINTNQQVQKIFKNNNQEEKQLKDLLLPENQTTNTQPIALDLLKIWNEEIGAKTNQIVQITKDRARFLIAAFKLKFDLSMQNWQIFCKKIASSDFLMGKIKSTFKISIDWALKFNTIQRIFEGDFGIGKYFENNFFDQNQSTTEDMLVQIENLDEELWAQKWRKAMLNTLGADYYKSWFMDAKLFKENGQITPKTQSIFVKDYWQDHFADLIAKMQTL
jgi:hypothetical protein